MTRARRSPTPPAAPLTEQVRSALTQGWHSLSALDALAAPARGSDARRAVHEALRALRSEGAALEERVAATGVEVRLGAPRCALSPEQVEEMGGPEGVAATEGEAVDLPAGDEPEPDDYTRVHDALAAGPVEAEPVDAASFYAARTRDTEDAAFDTWAAKKIAEAGSRDALEVAHLAKESEEALTLEAEGMVLIDRTPDANGDDAHYFEHGKAALAATKGSGPSSRCAVCSAPHARHAPDDGHAFAPKPRGRPRVPAAPIHDAAPAVLPRARQRAKRGPVVDVDGGRVERAPCPPCVDCGEEPGSCPEGRCRDCDMDHVCASGSCRECFVWIVREEVAGPLAAQHRSGCSLATAEDWHPRDAADVARVRARREEPEALSTDARAVYDAIKAACPTRAVLADGGTPNASAEPVHVAELDAAEELRRLLPHTRCPSVWHDVQCARESGHPCEDGRHHSAADWKDGIWTDEAAERWAQRAEKDPPPKPRRMRARVEGGTIVSYREPPPCRPPACHRDDIHEPSRVRGFDRPLCEAHRLWVEAAGGTLAAGGLAGVVRAP